MWGQNLKAVSMPAPLARKPNSLTRASSRRDRDWNNGVLLIAAIVGLPIAVVALVQLLWL